MEHAPIEYAKTSDGVSIAYSMWGDGPPVVSASNIFGTLHIHRSMSLAGTPMLAAHGRRVVLYDGRGMGASDRGVDDLSLETQLLDLEAVVDGLRLERFALTGFDYATAASVLYAVRHPERVSHLILRTPWASGARKASIPKVRVMFTPEALHWTNNSVFADKEWQVFAEVMAAMMHGFGAKERSRRLTAAMAAGTSPRLLSLYFEAAEK